MAIHGDEIMQVEQVAIENLIPYARNARTHSDAQVAQIAASIREFGFTNPVLVDEQHGIIAGHGRVMAARKLAMESVPCITLSGLSETAKRAYILADNKLALNAGWDDEMLAMELEGLVDLGFDLPLTGFSLDELSELNGKEDESNPYTDNVNSPVYEPTGEKPPVEELFDDEKAMDLITSIQSSSLPENEKRFLMTAASRHIVFDYAKIANFYAHSSAECQGFMEDSALVIIDFNKAIENGFVRLSDKLNEMFGLDEEGDE